MSVEIAITIFVLAISATFFLLPGLLGKFSENNVANIALTGGCIMIGYFSMIMNIAIIMEFAVAAGYSTAAFTTYMTVIFIIILVLMFYTVMYMIYTIIKTIKLDRQKARGLA
jgi:hypothetical protein